jgi:hypothetical protein
MKKFLAITLLLSVAGSIYAADNGIGSAPARSESPVTQLSDATGSGSAQVRSGSPVIREVLPAGDLDSNGSLTTPVRPKDPTRMGQARPTGTVMDILTHEYTLAGLLGAGVGGTMAARNNASSTDVIKAMALGTVAADSAIALINKTPDGVMIKDQRVNKALKVGGAAAVTVLAVKYGLPLVTSK